MEEPGGSFTCVLWVFIFPLEELWENRVTMGSVKLNMTFDLMRQASLFVLQIGKPKLIDLLLS